MDKTEEAQKKYYDEMALLYDEHYFAEPARNYRAAIYDRFLPINKFNNIKVLNAMAGGGESSAYFMARGAEEVTAVDISESCCDIYRKRFPQNRVICRSILDTGLPDNEFDFAVTDSLHHLHPHVDQAVTEILRMLKPGGYLFIWEPSAGSLVDIMRKIWYKMDKKFFLENEASIDVQRLATRFNSKMELQKIWYGGSFAYVFVMLSMYFRISPEKIARFAPAFMRFERWFDKIQPKFLSSWVLCLFQKHMQ